MQLKNETRPHTYETTYFEKKKKYNFITQCLLFKKCAFERIKFENHWNKKYLFVLYS